MAFNNEPAGPSRDVELEEKRKRKELEELAERLCGQCGWDMNDHVAPGNDCTMCGANYDALKQSPAARYPHTVPRMEGKKNRAPKVGDKVILFGWQDYHGAKVIEVSTNGRIRVRYHADDGYVKRWKDRVEYKLM